MDSSLPMLSCKHSSPTCVWMDAGAVAFRLCDRGYQCDHCPFDAAMRGTSLEADADASGVSTAPSCAWSFPADRLYTDAHLWVQTIGQGPVRVGLDAFAARLLHPVLRVLRTTSRLNLARGEPWCAIGIDGGDAWLGMPLSGQVRRWNPALPDDPSLVSSDSYASGWIAEIEPRAHRPDRSLIDADAAQDLALYDARQYRRHVVLQLLSEAPSPAQATGDELRLIQHLLGRAPRVALARQFLRSAAC